MRRTISLFLILLLALAVASLMAGCGSSEQNQSEAKPTTQPEQKTLGKQPEATLAHPGSATRLAAGAPQSVTTDAGTIKAETAAKYFKKKGYSPVRGAQLPDPGLLGRAASAHLLVGRCRGRRHPGGSRGGAAAGPG